jgi:predicted nucleic acid-binding protein
VRFWDTSAIVPLLVDEDHTRGTTAELELDPSMLVWWGTIMECVSAVARRERQGNDDAKDISTALQRLAGLSAAWEEVQPAARLRQTAERLLRVHPLRAADALQLAAAIAAADGDPRSLPFVTLDARLARAAEREGFPVVEPA